jgi:hypothetical protein
MAIALDDHTLARVLPGTWVLAATNIPVWIDGQRLSPTFTWQLVSAAPIVLADDASWESRSGEARHVFGVDTQVDGGFVWRGKGLQRLTSSSWQVAALSEDGGIATIRYSRSRLTAPGINVLVRSGVEPAEIRATIANSASTYGLSAEDFASLGWLDQHGPRPVL